MRIVLLGPPGSGKADLSQQISDHYGMPIITVNSVMQRAAAEQTELGRLAKEAMDSARVSDELLLALLRIQLPQSDLAKGFILVDLPRNAGQADVLDSVLNDLGAGIELVLNLQVDPDELMERLVGRIACDNCGAQYNLYINPPMVDGVCDTCGARVIRRPDDYEETISNRLRVYEGQMGPLLQYYQLTDKLHRMEADDGIPKVWKLVRKLLDALPPSEPPTSVVSKKSQASGKSKTTAKAKSKTSEPPAAQPTKVAKKATVKKAEPEKAEPKKAQVKKAAAKKAAAKTAAPKEAAAKKVVARKAAPKKAATKKSVPKKAAAKKAVAKKAVAKKAAKKAVAKKKAVGKKGVVKKAAAKKSVVKKATAKKATAKKATAKKATAKKATAKKAMSGKSVAKKVPAKKKPPVKKTAATKATKKKAPAKKSVAKKKVVTKKKVAAKKAKKKSARR